MIRKREELTRLQRAPFSEDEVVVYPQRPARKIIVAHCYLKGLGSKQRWVVAEINGDTHDAAELCRASASEHN